MENLSAEKTHRISPDLYFFENESKTIVFQKRTLKSFQIDSETRTKIEKMRSKGNFGLAEAATDDGRRDLVEAMLRAGMVEPIADRVRGPEDDTPDTSGPLRIAAYRIVLTEACNLRCTYCFQEETTDRQTSMSSATMHTVIDRMLEAHGPEDHISIHWFGGEPLLRFKLIREAMDRLGTAVADGRLKGIAYDMTTHGGLVNDHVARYLAQHDVHVLVSLDGGKALNDRARVDKKGRGTFDMAVRGYETLRRHGVDVGVIVTSSVETGTELAQGIRDLLDMLKPRRLHVNTPQPTARGWEVDGRVFAEQLGEAAALCAERGCELVGPQQKVRRALALSENQNLDCVAPNGGMAVSVGPDGQLGHCIVSWNGEDHSQRDSWDFDKAETWKTRSHKSETCRSCPAETVCGGPCPLEAELIGLDKQRCAFYLTTLKRILLE